MSIVGVSYMPESYFGDEVVLVTLDGDGVDDPGRVRRGSAGGAVHDVVGCNTRSGCSSHSGEAEVSRL